METMCLRLNPSPVNDAPAVTGKRCACGRQLGPAHLAIAVATVEGGGAMDAPSTAPEFVIGLEVSPQAGQ